MRDLRSTELNAVSGGTFSWFWCKPKISFCKPAPKCNPEPKCAPKPKKYC